MAASMNGISRHYSNSGRPDELPAIETVRLALNVAACDKRPLVIVVGRNREERQSLSRSLAQIAWSEDLIGQLTYTTSSGRDLDAIRGANSGSGYIFVAPNLFGSKGTALVQLNSSATPADLQRAAEQAIAQYNPQYLSHQDHVRLGHEESIQWQTAIPETDPHGPGRGMPGRDMSGHDMTGHDIPGRDQPGGGMPWQSSDMQPPW